MFLHYSKNWKNFPQEVLYIAMKCESKEINKLTRKFTLKYSTKHRDFPDGPVVKTPRFHFRGRGFDPWSEN